jgi:hypothetical protein
MNRFLVYLRRWSRQFKRTIDQEIKLNDVQKMAIQTCKRLICHKDSELIYAPISKTFYVEADRYYVRIYEDSITITNGKFSYYVWIPSNVMHEIKDLFNRISQSKSNRLESRYSATTLHNLKEICESIDKSRTMA